MKKSMLLISGIILLSLLTLSWKVKMENEDEKAIRSLIENVILMVHTTKWSYLKMGN